MNFNTLIYVCIIGCFLASCNEKVKPVTTDTMKETTKEMKKTATTMKLVYPETKMVDQVDDYHGTEIKDPYRWLEDDNAEDTKAWVKAQNEVTFGYLNSIPMREKIKKRYTELFNFPKLSTPYSCGDYYFFNKNDGLQNQSVVYRQKGLEGEPVVFMDPNKMSADGTTAVSIASFSQDKKYAAISKNVAGSDWQELYVMEVATGKKLPDNLEWVKFSGASWHGDGFFYSRYPEPKEGDELSATNSYHQIYYHKLGDDQSADKLIYENRKNPKLYHWTGVSENGKYLILNVSEGTEGNEVYFKDLKAGGDFKPMIEGFKYKTYMVHATKDYFLIMTNKDAPNYRLVKAPLNDPSPKNWKDVIPEKEDLLSGVNTGGGKMFATYLKNATNKIYRMDYDGTNISEVALPGVGSAGGLGGYEDDKTLFYSFTSFLLPGVSFKYDVATGKSTEFRKTELKFDPNDYEEKQVFYPSKDGTKVSMFIVHKKGLKLDGNNPTYLYGYGGFNVSLSPSFSTSRIILLENGGVFAMPNLRGGGEYGEDWHKEGMLDKKQNVFDDFIYAAKYLMNEGYTKSEKLAIAGGSNGGLLVGACMTQQPDMFAVAFPAVGVLDMLRYHKFTVGFGWVPEYGSSDDPEQFKTLIKYSPLHNLKDGTAYPATMITTADHDDRVVPAHSFKYAAQLQKSHVGPNPVLIRIAVDAGHGAGKPVSKIIEEQADQWSFMFKNTGTEVIY